MMIDMAEARGAAERAERVQAVVIGGGVVGCTVLRELALRGIDAVLLEAEADIGQGTSKANSAILHSGYDAKPGTTEAALLRRSRELWPELIDELGVPFLAVGAVMLAMTSDERRRLVDEIVPVADAHGVPTEVVDGAALRELAPFVTPDAAAGLHIPAEGIVDPFWLTRAFAESAIATGARVLTSAPVTALSVEGERVEVTTGNGATFVADQAIDCAGLWADDVAALAGDTSFSIRPRKGQFLVSEMTFGVDRIVLPIPGPMGKGMLVTPIIFGGVLLGPTAEDIDDKRDRSTDRATRDRVIDACAAMVPDVRRMTPIRQFAGLRAASSTGDYILRPSTAGDRLHIVAGIRSTGISASAAIAEAVVEEVAARRGWGTGQVRAGRPVEPDWDAVAGEVVCVCRSVAEAEISAALARPSPAVTVDGLKRRCGAGFGDCQGNLCQIDLVARLAERHDREPWQIEKDGRGSWIVAGASEAGATAVPEAAGMGVAGGSQDRDPVDVVVVGGGPAGIGVALAASDAGWSVTVVDRGRGLGGSLRAIDTEQQTAEERAALEALRGASDARRVRWRAATTVVGLRADGDGWLVDCQDRDGSEEIAGTHVVLATGGYLTPREHRPIDGPRPSGLFTADSVSAALDRGWLPARRAVIVGRGRLARSTAHRLAAAGASVRRIDDAARIDAIRGIARLDGIHNESSWLDADALVFADALSPATFLLRGLGLVDDGPGVPAPVHDDGSLELPGLWAAGACVTADVDHEDSLRDGRRVGEAIAAAQRPAVTANRGGGLL
jgi:glycerol-3-phosphate dehydrogenase